MKIVAIGRQEGKTTLCVDYMKQNPKVHMIVWAQRSVDIILSNHPELKGRIHPATMNRIEKISKNRDIEALIIDAIDECLLKLTGKVVRMITITQDDPDSYI